MAYTYRKFLLVWAPVLLYVTMIFVSSSMSKVPHVDLIKLPDKLLHFLEYALLAALVARALQSMSWPSQAWAVLLITLLVVCALGGLDELYQSSVNGRDADVLDWTADAAGGLVGAIMYLLARRMWIVRSRPTS